MTLVGRLTDEHSLSAYLLQIDASIFQFMSSFLKLTTTKTRVTVWRGRTTQPPKPIFIEVEIVNSFKYLGTLLYEYFSSCDHVN